MKFLITILILFLFSLNSLQASVYEFTGIEDTVYAKPIQSYRLKHDYNLMLATLDGKESENSYPLESGIDYTRLMIASGAALAVGVTVHMYQANAWWQEQDSKFRIVNDWEYARWIDKTGHFFGTNLIAHAFSGAYEAANFQAEESAIFSAASALAFELFIEIEDGFGPQWGFSPGDATADFLGASFYLSQYYFPYMKNFQPRVSYIPSQEFKDNPDKIIIDDYEGQKYWVGMRMKNILPDKLAEYWPSFLMLSAGMGVSHLDGKGGGVSSFYLALDLDAEQIPLYGGFWQFVKNTLNYIHFPMPGIRISPNTAFFGIVF